LKVWIVTESSRILYYQMIHILRHHSDYRPLISNETTDILALLYRLADFWAFSLRTHKNATFLLPVENLTNIFALIFDYHDTYNTDVPVVFPE